MLLEEVREPEEPIPEEEPEIPEESDESEPSGRSGISVSGVTSSETSPSGWEEVDPFTSDELELSELSVPLEMLVLPELRDESELEVEELEEGTEELTELEDEIEELLEGFLPHPAKATAKTAANANKEFFISSYLTLKMFWRSFQYKIHELHALFEILYSSLNKNCALKEVFRKQSK